MFFIRLLLVASLFYWGTVDKKAKWPALQKEMDRSLEHRPEGRKKQLHFFEGGDSSYSASGRTRDIYRHTFLRKYMSEGAQNVLQAGAPDEAEPGHRVLVKQTLVAGMLDEPTEMTVLSDLSVLILERKGQVWYYDNRSKELTDAGKIPVFTDAEMGLMGVQRDPSSDSPFVYVYYAPLHGNHNRLSRFLIDEKKLSLPSEKIVLEVPVDRWSCCHTGGSIAFGPNHLLYLSTGDNSTPFNPFNEKIKSKFTDNGFPPMDERPGYEGWNALRSAANTLDLRGKILRISINNDGTYSIPEGNLFSPGDSLCRPEIYIMGCRNPYRISVDPVNGNLFWGDIGPDAIHDSVSRGPKGYDELNRAAGAGFYGWPMFIGNNSAYRAYDYVTGEPGSYFDAAAPVNRSRLNSGRKHLPEAKGSLLAYSYAPSPQRPHLGSGARSIMAGPAFRTEVRHADSALPAAFDGRLFFFDWSRGWINTIGFREDSVLDIRPFMRDTKFKAPIDLELATDGTLYVLEYGEVGPTGHSAGSLSKISYTPVQSAMVPKAQQQKIVPGAVSKGQALFNQSDCRACHQVNAAVIGPSLTEIAHKYSASIAHRNYLMEKIRSGGSGVWGGRMMPPHAELSARQRQEIVDWIFTLKKTQVPTGVHR